MGEDCDFIRKVDFSVVGKLVAKQVYNAGCDCHNKCHAGAAFEPATVLGDMEIISTPECGEYHKDAGKGRERGDRLSRQASKGQAVFTYGE